MNTKNDLDPSQFFTKFPLYKKISFNKDNIGDLMKIVEYDGNIDIYCPDCKKERTFNHLETYPFLSQEKLYSSGFKSYPSFGSSQDENDPFERKIEYLLEDKFYIVRFKCASDNSHILIYLLRMYKGNLMIIGQYPSYRDINTADLIKYEIVLSKEKFLDFKSAEMCFSNGYGVGAFIYLRRIIEFLVEEIHKQELSNPNFNEEEYKRKRWNKKIEQLKDYLPEYLVKNRKIFGILSKGVHELSEKECIEFYPVIKISIELILQEKINKIEKEKIINKNKSELSNIINKIK